MSTTQPTSIKSIPHSIIMAISIVDGFRYCEALVKDYSVGTQGWIRQYNPILEPVDHSWVELYEKAQNVCVGNGWDFTQVRGVVKAGYGLTYNKKAIDAANLYEQALNHKNDLSTKNSDYWDEVISNQNKEKYQSLARAAEIQAQGKIEKAQQKAKMDAEQKQANCDLIREIIKTASTRSTLRDLIDHQLDGLVEYIYLHPRNQHPTGGYSISLNNIKEYLMEF